MCWFVQHAHGNELFAACNGRMLRRFVPIGKLRRIQMQETTHLSSSLDALAVRPMSEKRLDRSSESQDLPKTEKLKKKGTKPKSRKSKTKKEMISGEERDGLTVKKTRKLKRTPSADISSLKIEKDSCKKKKRKALSDKKRTSSETFPDSSSSTNINAAERSPILRKRRKKSKPWKKN